MTYKYNKTLVLDYNIKDVYSIVANVEDYPKFIPWISYAKEINKIDEHIKEYELEVNFKIFKEKFTTVDEFTPYSKIYIKSSGGPFKTLITNWEFKQLESGKTEVIFYIEFEFKVKVLDIAFAPIFKAAQDKILHYFVDYAQKKIK